MLTIPDKAHKHSAGFGGVGVVKVPCTAAAQLTLYIYADYAGLASWGLVDRGGPVTLRAAFQIHLVRSPVLLSILLYIPRIGPGGVSSRGFCVYVAGRYIKCISNIFIVLYVPAAHCLIPPDMFGGCYVFYVYYNIRM